MRYLLHSTCLLRLNAAFSVVFSLLLMAVAARANGIDPGLWRERADPVFRHVSVPPAMLTTEMVQDDEGYLWLGTQNGLVRWDAYRFLNHTADSNTPGALPDSYITALHKDTAGRLWVGTSAGGLAWRDARRDRFEVLPGGPNGLSHVSVFAIADDPHGGLWVGTGAGLDHLAADGLTVRHHAQDARLHGLPDGAVQALLVDRAGGLWVGTRNGLFRRAPGQDRFESVALEGKEAEQPAIARLMLDAQARVWIGTRGHGAFVTGPADAIPTPVLDSERGGTLGLKSDSVLNLLEVTDGEVWLGTDGGGIVRVDTRSWRTRRVRHHDHIVASLAEDEIGPMLRDRSGIVWVATDMTISAYDPSQSAVSSWLGYAGSSGGISHTNIPSLLALPDETVWLGLGDGGVDIVEPRRGHIGQLRPDASMPLTALPKGRVLAMARSASGDIWLGTQHGLYLARPTGQRVVRVDVPGRSSTAATWAIHVDEDRLWIGGLDGLWGLHVPAVGPLQLLVRRDSATLGDQRVTSLFRATGHALWIGTRAGLVHFDPQSGALERLPQDARGRIGLQTGYISSVLTDRRGRLWVASYGGGVRIVDPAKPGVAPLVRRVDTRDGLPNDGVNAMLLDAHDDVWLSTDDGLACIHGADLTVTALRSADGVGIASYWTTSAAQTPSGAMLFGGNGGLTIVDPSRPSPWTFSAPLVITDVDGASGGHDARPTQLVLEPQQRNLKVEFSALDYSAPEQNRYAYRLRGFDKDWNTTDSTRRLARYTNLPPGDYVLELIGSNRQGVWSKPLDWPVHVGAAWYETSELRSAMVVFALLSIAGLVQARTLALRRRQQILEHLVTERTAELHESERRLTQMAYHDGLTGLANRRLFNDNLKHLLAAARRGQPFALLLIDLDRFKQINDTHGHDAGDAVLTMIAERLRSVVRDIDHIARLGGDEFAVLLSNIGDRAAVDLVCRRIIDSIAAPIDYRGSTLQTGASIGAAACPRDESSEDALYRAADQALYEAKRAGRGQLQWSRMESALTSV